MTTRKMKVRTDYPKLDSYSVKYNCANCGWSGTIEFAKGKRAPDTTTCPTCKVSGAKKSLTYRLPAPAMKDPVLIPIIPGAWPKNPPKPCPRPHNPWVNPWDVPARPYLEGIGNDIDRSDTDWREDTLYGDDFDKGLGFSQ